MIEFLLNNSILTGLFSTIAFIAIFGHLIYIMFYYVMNKYIGKKHEKIGRTLFRTSAGLLAFIISLNYANYRLSYLQIEESIEAEAAQLVDVYIDLRLYDSPAADSIKQDVEAYIQSIIDNEWSHVADKPFTSESMTKFVRLNKKIHYLNPESDLQKTVKASLIQDLDGISDYMQVRVYKTAVKFPYLLYIVLIGMILVYCFYTVYAPDTVSVIFLGLYNVFIAVIVYFVIVMSNPLRGPLKIKPAPFEIIMDKGINLVRDLPN